LRNILLFLALYTFIFADSITLDNINIQDSPINTISSEVTQTQAQETRSINLTEKLEQDISFNKASLNNGNQGISFRGLNFKATEYVEDGIPLYRSTGGLIDTNFNMTNANIKINDGSGVSSTGVSAMGGEVEISSSIPTKEIEVKLGSTISNNDEFYYSTLGTAVNDFYIQADASYYNRSSWELSNDYKPTITQGKGKRINSDKEQKNFSFKIGTFINDNFHIAAKISTSKAKYGLEPNIQAHLSNPFDFPYSRIDPKELNSYYLYLDYDYKDYEFSARAYYDDYKDTYIIYDDVEYQNYLFPGKQTTYDDSRVGVIFKATRNKNSSKTSFIFLDERDEHIRLYGGMDKIKVQLDTYKSSLLHIEQLNENFALELGLTYTLMTEHKASKENTQTIEDKNTLDGQIKLSYKNNKNTLYISGAKKSRMPAMAEMFAFFAWDMPDPNLKPEKSWQYSAGFKHDISKKSSINFDIYYYDVEDLIINQGNRYINQDTAKHYGSELRLNFKEFDKNNIRVSYAYAHTQDKNNNDLALVPSHKLILQNTVTITRNIDAFLSYSYISSQYSYNYPSDSNNLYKIGAYSLFDAQVSYSIKDKLSARIGVKNIMDKDYEWQYGFPAQGRSFYISLEWKL